MKYLHSISAAAFALGVSLSLSPPASAQTSAAGPYYATPSWDQTLPAATRYIVLSNMNSEAVLDRETGLVWEKTPITRFFSWQDARQYCVDRTAGTRKGWRLPTVDELATLYNTAGTGPTGGFPGAPFTLPGSAFWTSTIFIDNTGSPNTIPTLPTAAQAYIVSFTTGGNDGAFPQGTRSTFAAWCVRGASAGNVQ